MKFCDILEFFRRCDKYGDSSSQFHHAHHFGNAWLHNNVMEGLYYLKFSHLKFIKFFAAFFFVSCVRVYHIDQ